MKKLYCFLILMLFGCFNNVFVNGQTIQPIERTVGKLQIAIDPRMELLTVVQLLSNYPIIKRDVPYSKDVVNYFESFSSHEAVIMTDSLFYKGFSYHIPPTFMLHLSQPPELEQKITFTDDLKKRSGGGDNLKQFQKSIKQFTSISNFETFWNSKISLYNQILDLTIADLGEMDIVKILEDYFNETYNGYNVTISPSFGGGYGPSITDTDGNTIIYGCLSTTDVKDDIPYLRGWRLAGFVWHEFGHSFVNPLTDKHSDKVASLDKLFEPIKEDMTKSAYGAWSSCVNEHVVRAVVVRLCELHVHSQLSKAILEDELRQHFIYIEPLIEKLKDFENQRSKSNITFTEYYPELLNALDNLQP